MEHPRKPPTADEALAAFSRRDGETVAIYLEGMGRSLPAADRILLREIARALRPHTLADAEVEEDWRLEFKHRAKKRPAKIETKANLARIGIEVENRLDAELAAAKAAGRTVQGAKGRVVKKIVDESGWSSQTVGRAHTSYIRAKKGRS